MSNVAKRVDREYQDILIVSIASKTCEKNTISEIVNSTE